MDDTLPRMKRLVAVLFFLPLVAKPQTSSDSGVVTIFREKPTNRLKMFSMQDQWPVRLHKKMTLDGQPLVDMRGGEFVSYRLPVGRHSIQFERYGGPTADFDLHR